MEGGKECEQGGDEDERRGMENAGKKKGKYRSPRTLRREHGKEAARRAK